MNLNLILKSSIACEDKTNLSGFQVQNVIFLDCPKRLHWTFVQEVISVLNLVCLCFN